MVTSQVPPIVQSSGPSLQLPNQSESSFFNPIAVPQPSETTPQFDPSVHGHFGLGMQQTNGCLYPESNNSVAEVPPALNFPQNFLFDYNSGAGGLNNSYNTEFNKDGLHGIDWNYVGSRNQVCCCVYFTERIT